jgi:outer membrane lipoprotein-sorting protein
MTPKHARLSALLLALLCAPPAAADRSYRAQDAELTLDPQVRALLDRFEEAQASTETMTAEFRQVREDDLFAEAKVLDGAFWFTHPTNFRWEYRDEDAGDVVVLATKELVQRWIPSLNVVQQTDISKKSRRVFSYFGIGADVDNLRRRFDIRMGDASEHPGTEKLELRGRWRRLKKRLEVMEMWIDKEKGLPVAVRVVLPDGGSTTWQFNDMVVNPEIPAAKYTLELPDNVQVRDEDKKLSSTHEILDEIMEEDAEAEAPADGSAGSQG